MSTIQWIPSSHAATYGSKPILCIYVCAHGPQNVSADQARGSPKTNHWVLFCAISDSESVRIDPTPGGHNNSIVLILGYKSYLWTRTAIKTYRIVTNGLTVNGLLDIITEAKYDKYQFTQSGQGCRYWVYCLFTLLNGKGHLKDKKESDDLEQAIKQVWDESGNAAPASEQTLVQAGRFYALTQGQ